jgi:beta-mannosidase
LSDVELSDGWQLASTAPDEFLELGEMDGLAWAPARIPGTAAAALRDAGAWRPGDDLDFDARDWWFRTSFSSDRAEAGEEVQLALDGIATVSEVYLNDERVLDSDSMFAAHRLDVSDRVRAQNELAICCRALGPRLHASRKPRARWRTRLVSDGNLRFYRTMLLGRAPGFAPGPACVGPWKPVRLVRSRGVAIDELRLRTSLDGAEGRLSVQATVRALAGAGKVGPVSVELSGPSGTHRAQLTAGAMPGGVAVAGELVVASVERWWPHTHGVPALHEVRLLLQLGSGELAVPAGRVGFRDLRTEGELEVDGIQLRVNDVPVFARGAVWTPLDLTMPCSREPELRRVLQSVLDAGMNMLRVPGIGCYEGEAFYDLCDELGILVWQDFMFANLDYPEQDPAFMATVEREAGDVLSRLGPRPSLAVVCGSSEVAQQVAMLGLDPGLATGPLFGSLLPSVVADADVQAPYLPSTPWGGDLPFRPGWGVANYYGVGAYLRPLEDARRSEVRFAAESLAFSNVPNEETVDALGAPAVHHPRWKAAVPRDAGAGWDFEDVRDHYMRLLYDVEPVALRSVDHERYLALSRHLTGEVMAEVFGEWRREASPCRGALVLWLTDLLPGAGWGLLDSAHRPKVAYSYLRRVLAPLAVWSTDEGLGGIVAHVANDRPEPLQATLRIAMYRDHELPVEEVRAEVALAPHSGCSENVEELLGRFVDASWSYRFGPPAQDLIALSLERSAPDGAELLSQSFRFPAGRPLGQEPADRLGCSAISHGLADEARLIVSSRRFLYGVRVCVPGYAPDDDAFSVEPGHSREVVLRQVGEAGAHPGHLTALNLTGRMIIDT